METIENNQQPDNSNIINSEAKDYLLQACKLGNILAIVGYIVVALLVLMAVTSLNDFSRYSGTDVEFSIGDSGFIYFIIAAVVFLFPVSYLHQFSIQMKKGLISNDEEKITFGFKILKYFFKLMGVFIIVLIFIYIMVLIAL